MHSFAEAVRAGLSAAQKSLPSMYLYDDTGSALFQKIMDLPEYYPTRAEAEILAGHGAAIGAALGTDFELVELGAGDGAKTRLLIQALLDGEHAFRYTAIDISGAALDGLAAKLAGEFPALEQQMLTGDYFDGLAALGPAPAGGRLVLFLGSNLGNFAPDAALAFLKQLRAALRPGDHLLIGLDLKKDPDTLTRAYRDRQEVTAEFNLNLLTRINRELDADFDREQFQFYAAYNPLSGAVESSLIATEAHTVTIDALDTEIAFDAWEAIHTESSYKFGQAQIGRLAAQAGFRRQQDFSDQQGRFIDSLWQAC